jgi:hypothetical protein
MTESYGSPGRTRTSDPAVNSRSLYEIESEDGAAEGIRTPDPRITNAMLYQLSYCGYLTGDLQPACNRLGEKLLRKPGFSTLPGPFGPGDLLLTNAMLYRLSYCGSDAQRTRSRAQCLKPILGWRKLDARAMVAPLRLADLGRAQALQRRQALILLGLRHARVVRGPRRHKGGGFRLRLDRAIRGGLVSFR